MKIYDIEKATYFELWANKNLTETALFCPDQHTEKSYKLLTRDVYGKQMYRVASMKCGYGDAKLIQEEVLNDMADDMYGMI